MRLNLNTEGVDGMKKLKLIVMLAIISAFLTLIAGMVAAQVDNLPKKAGAQRILSEYSKIVSKEGKGRYYLVKPGEHFYEKQFTHIDPEKKLPVDSHWRARTTSTPTVRRVLMNRHARMAGRYINQPKEVQKTKQHRYAQRTLGTSKVDLPSNPRGRYYTTPAERYGKFTDKLSSKKRA